MARCNNKIEQLVPTRYDHNTVEGVCGQTGINGDPVFCEICIERGKKREWQQEQYDLKHNDY